MSRMNLKSLPVPWKFAARYPRARSPGGVTSCSDPAHHTPMKRSRGKPTAAASWMAVGFMMPQPHMITKFGRIWRPMRSQMAFCSTPGFGTGNSVSSKPCSRAKRWITGSGSLPKALS